MIYFFGDPFKMTCAEKQRQPDFHFCRSAVCSVDSAHVTHPAWREISPGLSSAASGNQDQIDRTKFGGGDSNLAGVSTDHTADIWVGGERERESGSGRRPA